jgi:hypothetical protein
MTTATATISCNGAVGVDVAAEGIEPWNHVILLNLNDADEGYWIECTGGISNLYLGTVEYPNVSDIDPTLAAGAIGAGFFVLLPLWAALYGGRALLAAIRS